MENKEIKEILEEHKKWLDGSPDGSRANLRRADLYSADLRRANLRRADLSRANLSGADLSRADLSRADLYGADLSRADLSRADLYGADLSGADLRGADLSGADLRGADLSRANLSGADLSRADLSRANLENVKINYPIACPEEGRFIGFKKSNENYIIKLEITKDAKRSSATTRKCRCSKARVIGISTIEGEPKSEAKSKYDSTFIYRVGEIVEVNDFDENRWNECSTGIHFFITRQEAIDY